VRQYGNGRLPAWEKRGEGRDRAREEKEKKEERNVRLMHLQYCTTVLYLQCTTLSFSSPCKPSLNLINTTIHTHIHHQPLIIHHHHHLHLLQLHLYLRYDTVPNCTGLDWTGLNSTLLNGTELSFLFPPAGGQLSLAWIQVHVPYHTIHYSTLLYTTLPCFHTYNTIQHNTILYLCLCIHTYIHTYIHTFIHSFLYRRNGAVLQHHHYTHASPGAPNH